MNLTTFFILCALGGYLLGSIPFGLVLTRLAGLGDIRKIGSGNIGATNVLRTGHWGLALLTVILDASKAAVAAVIAYLIAHNYNIPSHEHLCDCIIQPSTTPLPNYLILIFSAINSDFLNAPIYIFASLIAGTCAILGHNFPVWLKFKGGKGVASTFGFILVTDKDNVTAKSLYDKNGWETGEYDFYTYFYK